MALVLADRVQESTTTTGTTDFALGGAVTGFQTFTAGVGNSNTCYYAALLPNTSEWEVGLGTVSSDGLTLVRTSVYASSTGSKVSFSAGQKFVFVTYPAEKSVNLDAAGNVSALGTIASGVWNGTAITDAYLATISTAGKVANSATTATNSNTASTIVARDASGNFSAGTITAALSGNASTATAATNLAGGVASQIPYQTGANTTSFIANGNAGEVLTSNGTSAPTWQAPASSGATKAQAIAYAMTLGF